MSTTEMKIEARACLECGTQFPVTRSDRIFCTPICKRAYHRRNELRGAAIVPKLLEWRMGRHKKGGGGATISDIAAMVDGWVEDDRRRMKGRGDG